MRILYGAGFSCEETEDYRIQIFHNLIHGLKDVLDSLPQLSIALSFKNLSNARLLASAKGVDYFVSYPTHLCEPLRSIWEDSACETWRQRRNDDLKYGYIVVRCF
jgi:G-protein alpha subunit.